MWAMLLSLIPVLLKLIVPLISAWFAKTSADRLGVSPDATMQHWLTYVGGWAGVAATSFGSGEWLAHTLRRNSHAAAGEFDVERLRKIIALILQLIQLFMPEKAAAIHSAVAVAFPDEASRLDIHHRRA